MSRLPPRPGVIRVAVVSTVTNRALFDDGRSALCLALGGAARRTLVVRAAAAYRPTEIAMTRDAWIEAIRADVASSGILTVAACGGSARSVGPAKEI